MLLANSVYLLNELHNKKITEQKLKHLFKQ